MKWGVVVFPGSNCDQDCVYVLKDVLRQPVTTLWHADSGLQGCDAIVLPGGFSYGDYLRTGAIAKLSPIMGSISRFAKDGGLVIGICNGFQILLEAGLLPGAMLRNTGLNFICRFVTLRVERTDTPFTNRFQTGQMIRLPIAHNEGRYTIDAKPLPSIPRLAPPRPGGVDSLGIPPHGRRERDHPALAGWGSIQSQVVFRYCDENGQLIESANPNGSTDFIAGITNRAGNILGMMPHPERSAEPELGSSDGRLVFESMLEAFAHA